MEHCSDFLNAMSIGVVRISGNARYRCGPYNLIMLDWYLIDWLKSLQVSQAELGRRTDYPKAKVSDLVTGKQRYNRDILNDIAAALNIRPHELLMAPADAMGLRRMRTLAEQMITPEYGGVAGGDTPVETRKAG